MATNNHHRGGAILWFRRDLRLADHAALERAVAAGGPVWPVYILDETTRRETGAAGRWRLGESLRALAADIAARGGRLILRDGDPAAELERLIAETGADAVFWTRLYTPDAMARDTAVKKRLRAAGVTAESVAGDVLMEPWTLETKTGGPYRVYTPFWRALRAAYAPPEPIAPPAAWPAGDAPASTPPLEALELGAEMDRGAAVVARFAAAGEAAAQTRLEAFLADRLAPYAEKRNALGEDGASGLSPHLALGEISPHRVWRATQARMAAAPETEEGAWSFLSEIAWRDFAAALGYHTPEIFDRNWRSEWDQFPWRGDNEDAEAWRRGRTGEPLIDAAMRELYVTGVMHNRARMLVASYLCKHLMTDWRIGAAWFKETLVDHDLASNAMGWQWTAGSGPDAAPFFRVFNPATQAKKFDPTGAYLARWLPDAAVGGLNLGAEADGRLFFEACPRAWSLSPDDPYPKPIVDLSAGRERALSAYSSLRRAS